MFDDAVMTFGLNIEGLLQERNKDGKYKHRLDKLLLEDDEKPVKRKITAADIAKIASWGKHG